MNTVTQVCLSCKNSFSPPLKEWKRGGGKYCSKQCSYKRIRTKTLKKPNHTCALCSLEFYRKESTKKNSRSGLYFCSRKCKEFAQSLNGNFTAIQPSHYGTCGENSSDYRLIAFRNLEAVCTRCKYNRYKSVLVVHHKNRNREDNSLDNLEILCPTCHAEEHYLAHDGLYNRIK